MKNKLIYIFITIVLCAGFFFLGNSTNNKSPLKFSDTARLMEDGSEVNILIGKTKGGLGIEFIFLDRQNSGIINTLSVENTNIGSPKYRIVKGNKHDWLVVTTIGTEGTGYIEYIDNWYMVTGWVGGIQKVLSYNSKIEDNTTGVYKEVVANVINNNNIDDNVLNIEFKTKTCIERDKCSTSSKVSNYVWNIDKQDDSKSSFVLKK